MFMKTFISIIGLLSLSVQAQQINDDYYADDVLKAIMATAPLSQTMGEMISSTREWAKGRAVPASTAEPEGLDKSNAQKPRLKQEGENPFI